jgi:hypothetical protein
MRLDRHRHKHWHRAETQHKKRREGDFWGVVQLHGTDERELAAVPETE